MDVESPGSFAIIAGAAVLAPILAELLRRFRVPSVVLEVGLGIVIGPALLGWAEVTTVNGALADFGLAFLMFLAGYELDFARVRGRPLDRAVIGWFCSLLAGLAVGAVLVVEGFDVSDLLIALALTTTSLGALIPILQDAGVLRQPFGTYTLASGAIGEFGPVVAITLLLIGDNPLSEALWLSAFVVVAVGLGYVATRPQPPRFDRLISRHLTTSSQLPIRIAVLLLAALLLFAYELGLEALLGSFTAGMLFRPMLSPEQRERVEPRLTAIGFGFLIPVFFIVSGMRFDLDAITSDVGTALMIPMFLLLLLVVRGGPALFVYRGLMPPAQRRALALFQATALPLLVVITEIGRQTGRMSSADAAAVVGAGMLSVLLFPVLGLAQLKSGEDPEVAPESEPQADR